MTTIQTFDANVNLLRAVLWQYENADGILSVLRAQQEWVNENNRDFWERWRVDVFDLETANDFGLAVWARILNINTGFTVAPSKDKAAFGFGANHQNFGNGNFARGTETDLGLTTEQKRLLLKLRFRQLTTRPTVYYINEMLADVFGSQGGAFLHDPLDMTYAVYFFDFTPDSQTQLLLEKFDVLPRPSGVGVKWQVQIKPSFGFGVHHLNFENGNFGG